MQLLVVSQYFWPEPFIINNLTRILREQGHTVVVATGKPNYPDGEIYSGYSAAGVQKEIYHEDIEVFRVPLRPRGKGGALNLFLNYLSFVFSGLRWFPSLLRGYTFDAIVVFAGSPNVSLPALPLKWIKRAHLAIWVLDLWPESLKATGFIRNRVLLKLVGLLVRIIYSVADTILVQSPAFNAPTSRYAHKEKILYYPSSLDIAEILHGGAEQLPVELLDSLKTYFCVVFAGNIGTAQAVETLIEATSQLKVLLPDIRMVLVGSGSMLEWVRRKKMELALDNLILPGRFPMSLMPELYRHAACLLVTLKDEEIFSYTVPCKVQSYLAAGKPIIAALNGEGARVVSEAGAGLTCPAEDALALASCIKFLYFMPEAERSRFGIAGRRYFFEHFEMRRQARRLVEILEERIAKTKVKSTAPTQVDTP